MIYDPEEPGAFVIYSMEEMKEVGRVETDPFFIVHMINAYDDVAEDGTEIIVLDSTNMVNGDILEVYFYDVNRPNYITINGKSQLYLESECNW